MRGRWPWGYGSVLSIIIIIMNKNAYTTYTTCIWEVDIAEVQAVMKDSPEHANAPGD